MSTLRMLAIEYGGRVIHYSLGSAYFLVKTLNCSDYELMNAQSIQIQSIEHWDEKFFLEFCALRNSIYKDHPDFLKDDLSDMGLFFSPHSFFNQAVEWKAVLISQDGKSIARYLLSMNPKSEEIYLGYFECLSAVDEVQKIIFTDVRKFKNRFPQLQKIVGPVQGTLFGGYRFREQTDRPRFLGESLHLESYPEMWKSWGFAIGEYWDSFEIPPASAFSFYSEVENRFSKFWTDPKIVCRGMNRSQWASELKDIFRITIEAYKLKNTNDEVDEKIFATISEKIRPIVSASTVKILEYDGKMVGFNICYPDIQSEIRKFNLRKRYLPTLVNKLLLIAGIKLGKHPLLLVYVAKSDDCPIKWSMAKLAVSMIEDSKKANYPTYLSVLNAESAGSRASLPGDKILHSRHFLMSRPIP